MAHVFDYSASQTELNFNVNQLLVASSSYQLVATDFWSDSAPNYLELPLEYHAWNGNIATALIRLGGTGLGEILFDSDANYHFPPQPPITPDGRAEVPPEFFAHGGNHMLATIGDDGGYSGQFVRFVGLDAITRALVQLRSTPYADEGALINDAQAILDSANAAVGQAMQARWETLLSNLVRIEAGVWYPEDPINAISALHMQLTYSPDRDSLLTVADLFGPTGSFYTPYFGNARDLRDVFGPNEDVTLRLTRLGDRLGMAGGFSAGLMRVEAGAGDDVIWLSHNPYTPPPTNVPAQIEVLGETGDDSIETSASSDARLYGGDGNDIVRIVALTGSGSGAQASARIDGGDGDDDIYGGSFSHNTLYGGTGSDRIWAGGFSDLVDGGPGDDTINGGADRTVASASGDTINGGAGNDSILGSAWADRIDGGVGADTLFGLGDNDTLTGGRGLDSFMFDIVRTRSASLGRVVIDDDGGTLDFSNIRPRGLGLLTSIEVTFRRDANALEIDIVDHPDESIRISSFFKAPDAWVARGYVVVGYFSNGQPIYSMEQTGAPINLALARELGIVRGTTNADTLRGGLYNDWIYGLGGDDRQFGYQGSDFLVGGNGNDSLNGGSGNDKLNGGNGNDTVLGSLGSDTLSGEKGADRLDGNEGNDRIYGGAGHNHLDGSEGQDSLYGGTGSDEFSFHDLGTSNTDRIYGFSSLQQDHVWLDFKWGGLSSDSLSATQFRSGVGATTAVTAAQRVIYDTTTGTLYFDKDGAGGSAAQVFAVIDNKAVLTANDFHVLL